VARHDLGRAVCKSSWCLFFPSLQLFGAQVPQPVARRSVPRFATHAYSGEQTPLLLSLKAILTSRMRLPREFIEAFLREKAMVYADANTRLEPVLRKYFGDPLSRRAEDFLLCDRQVVEETSQSGSSALVTTRADFRTAAIRIRYHLSAVRESWCIIRMDRPCFCCGGTGKVREEFCRECGGEGWCDQDAKRIG